jgi:hypothetical protein
VKGVEAVICDAYIGEDIPKQIKFKLFFGNH